MATLIAKQDRLKSGIERIVRAIWPRIDYLATYSAVVKAQLGDGSLDLQFDDARMPGGATGGIQGIPIDTGIPGVTFTIAVGARVLVVFADGDPSKPRVTEWEKADVQQINITGGVINIGGGISQINIGQATQLVARQADPVQAGPFAGTILQPTQLVTKA